MQQREDVVIVGAGVVGLASAVALLEAGRGVRVIDAGRVGGGSSHGNCGTITPSHAPPLAAPGVIVKALRWMLTPDAPLYVPPRLDPALWAWLWRFAGRCNTRHWHAGARAKAALLNFRRLARAQDDRLAQALQRNLELDRTFAFAGRVDTALGALQVGPVNQALRAQLKPESMAFMLAGDFKQP
jgi:glycine/D-amino acid oxidase-like deaminating enzyme